MKIATSTLATSVLAYQLLRRLAESPDVMGLQKLKAFQRKFPEAAVGQAGYGLVWHG
jgi:exodeoxyribonuclease III